MDSDQTCDALRAGSPLHKEYVDVSQPSLCIVSMYACRARKRLTDKESVQESKVQRGGLEARAQL